MDETRSCPPAGRRGFLRATGATLGGSWLKARLPLLAGMAAAVRRGEV